MYAYIYIYIYILYMYMCIYTYIYIGLKVNPWFNSPCRTKKTKKGEEPPNTGGGRVPLVFWPLLAPRRRQCF